MPAIGLHKALQQACCCNSYPFTPVCKQSCSTLARIRHCQQGWYAPSLLQVGCCTHIPPLCLQAFTEDSRTALRSTHHPDEDKTVLPCGCYSTGPRSLGTDGDQSRFEHCLMIGDGERVRIVQELKQDGGAWKATTVEVSCL